MIFQPLRSWLISGVPLGQVRTKFHEGKILLETVEASEESVPFTPPQGQIVLKCHLESGGKFYF
jgi:hypothetical protein